MTKRSRRPSTTQTPKKDTATKRSKEKEVEVKSETEDDDELVTKRMRPPGTRKKVASTLKGTKKNAQAVTSGAEEESEPRSEEDDEPIVKPRRKSKATKTPKKAASDPVEPKKGGWKPKAVKETQEEEGPKLEEEIARKSEKKLTSKKPRSPSKKKDKSVKVEESGEESKSAAEEAELASDDDMKPAIAPKARKEVAERLSGKAESHPFPNWPAGSPTPYAALVKTFTLFESTTKRLEKLSHASLFMRQVLRLTPNDLLMVIHLMINKLAADYEGVELGIGESLIMKAIGESCGRSLQKIKEDQKEIGDLGMVAMKSRNNQKTLFKPQPLTVKSVHKGLLEIATIKGEGGQGRKVAGIKKLLAAAQGDEAKFLVRGLEGKLRTGLAENTVIVALSQAAIVHELEGKGQKASVPMLTEAEMLLRSVYRYVITSRYV